MFAINMLANSMFAPRGHAPQHVHNQHIAVERRSEHDEMFANMMLANMLVIG